MTTLNIFQAAFKLRNDYAHTGITLDYVGDVKTNTYFIVHDALHTYTKQAPEEEFEPIVLSIEMILGGVDYTISFPGVSADELSSAIASIPSDVIEELISFYTGWFN
jgi:hypothetical protein